MKDYTTNASVNLMMNCEQPKKVLEEMQLAIFNNIIAQVRIEQL